MDWQWIGNGLAPIGTGLTMDWQWIGTDWHRIDNGLAMDWHRLALDWQICLGTDIGLAKDRLD